MQVTQLAERYLAAFSNGSEFPGGLSYRKALLQSQLDYSIDSLKRIDRLLDQIREQHAPQFDAFVQQQANQNFLYVLAFYVGKTIERNSPAAVSWISHQELIAESPDMATVWPYQFESSIICRIKGPVGYAGGGGDFLPLSAMVIRLFEGPDEKSIWFSATGYIPAAERGAADEDAPAATPAPALELEAPAVVEPQDAEPVVYEDGSPIVAGDAVLADGRCYPVVIESLICFDNGQNGVLVSNGKDQKKPLTAAEAKAELLLVERNSSNPRAAGIRWLQQRAAAPEQWAHAQYALGKLCKAGFGVERNFKNAAQLFLQAAQQGHAGAQYELGILFNVGEGMPEDENQALHWFRSAAEQEHAPAMAVVGSFYENGSAVAQSLDSAEQWYRRAIAHDNAFAMYCLGDMYVRRVPDRAGEGVDLLRQAAERGYVDAQFRLAWCYSEALGTRQDYAQCVHWYRLAAQQGHAAALCNLADKYEHGHGIAQDLQLARELYLQAAERNVIAAWYSLGVIYQEGRGVEPDLEQAAQWLERAARYDFGDARARLEQARQARVGTLLARGKELLARADSSAVELLYEEAGNVYDPAIPDTLPLAFQLYKKAAEQGHAEAQLQVAFRFLRGLGVDQSPMWAAHWYQKSATQGYDEAQVALARLYEAGTGVRQDKGKARYWWKQAAAQGHPEAAGTVHKPWWQFWT